MKKIIYSFVIMIAAGSLFTSCVENTEPQGIKDIRQAKADYIESLSKLNAANEKLVAAEAAYKEAETAVKNAEVAVVEAQAAQAQALAAQEQARVEIIKAQAEAAKIANEKAVAALNHQLALDSLALVEKLIEMAQSEQINALFIEAQKAELAKQLAMDSARIMQMFLEIAEQQEVYAYNAELRKADLEEYKARVEKNIKGYEADIARYEADIRDAQDRIAKAEAQAQKDALDLEKELVEKEAALLRAKHALEQQEAAYLAYLAKVELQSYTLTKEEQKAVTEYKNAYTAVIAAKQKVRKAEERVFNYDTTVVNNLARTFANLQEDVATDSSTIESYKKQIADVEARLASLPDSGKTGEEIAALVADYDKQIKDLEIERANVEKEWNYYKATELDAPITGFASELTKWVVDNAALPAPFDMHFKAELPDNGAVSALFAGSVKDLRPYVETGKSEVNGKKYIVANFETSADALYGVYALDSIIDAISRKYIIDRVGTDFDTVGLKAAVKAAEKEYNDIADALTKGLAADTAYANAVEEVAKAVEDAEAKVADSSKAWTANVAAYKAHLAADTTAKDAKDTLVSYKNTKLAPAKADSTEKGATYKQDSTAYVTARTAYEKAKDLLDTLNNLERKYIAEAAGDTAKYKTLLDAAQLAYETAAVDSAKAKDAWKDAVAKDSSEAVIAKLKSKSDEATVAFRNAQTELNGTKKAYENAKAKLTALEAYRNIDKDAQKDTVDVKYTADTTAAKKAEEAKLALDKAVAAYNAAVAHTDTLDKAYKQAVKDSLVAEKDWLKKDTIFRIAQRAAVAAEEHLDSVSTLVPAAKNAYYKNVYCYFWGVDTTKVNDGTLFDTETGFLKDSIKIAPKEFADIFIKDGGNDIVKFNPTYGYNHGDDPKFIEPVNGIKLVENKEIDIIKDRLSVDYNVDFDNTLLYTLFAKQQAAEDIFAKVGTIDNEKALEALKAIKDELAKEFVKAGQKQEEASKPFFAFVQDLVGEDCLNTIFTNIDKALKAYAPYVNEPATWTTDKDKLGVIAKLVGTEKVTSKQLFTYWFEIQMCNKWGEGSYHDVYVALQVANASVGEQVKTLITDVLTSAIKSMSKYESWKELTEKDNVIETILFGTIEGVTLSNITDFIVYSIFNSSNYVGIANKAIVDFQLMPYFTGDLGGVLAELQAKYFADWAEAWAGYQKEIAVIDAQKDAVYKLWYVLNEYVSDPAIKSLMTKEWCDNNIIFWLKGQLKDAEKDLADDLAELEAFVADPTLEQQHIAEHYADLLAKAENDLAIAEAALERATAAYNKVLESHSIAE